MSPKGTRDASKVRENEGEKSKTQVKRKNIMQPVTHPTNLTLPQPPKRASKTIVLSAALATISLIGVFLSFYFGCGATPQILSVSSSLLFSGIALGSYGKFKYKENQYNHQCALYQKSLECIQTTIGKGSNQDKFSVEELKWLYSNAVQVLKNMNGEKTLMESAIELNDQIVIDWLVERNCHG